MYWMYTIKFHIHFIQASLWLSNSLFFFFFFYISCVYCIHRRLSWLKNVEKTKCNFAERFASIAYQTYIYSLQYQLYNIKWKFSSNFSCYCCVNDWNFKLYTLQRKSTFHIHIFTCNGCIAFCVCYSVKIFHIYIFISVLYCNWPLKFIWHGIKYRAIERVGTHNHE